MAEADREKEGRAKPGTTFRYVGNHPQDLANGQFLGPGDFVDLDQAAQDEAHNKGLIDGGLLIPA